MVQFFVSCKFKRKRFKYLRYGLKLTNISKGIAATLLQGGKTAHSMLQIPIDTNNESMVCNIKKKSSKAEIKLKY